MLLGEVDFDVRLLAAIDALEATELGRHLGCGGRVILYADRDWKELEIVCEKCGEKNKYLSKERIDEIWKEVTREVD